MPGDVLRVAIASDLHVVTDTGPLVGTSHLRAGDDEQQHGRQPIGGLLNLIGDAHLQADVLLCPGDIADKANPDGLKYGWTALHRVAASLGCKLVAGTTGNHDVDSRLTHHKFDPLEVLKSLVPLYPFPDEAVNGKYWMRHFVAHEHDLYRLIVLNSSAYHAGNPQELERGRISSVTIERIEQYLRATPDVKPINVFLCHHHPQQHSELSLGDYDWMREGQLLLDLLGSGRYGRWIVVHGHKHHPKITYASGTSVSPVVLSAGSFSAVLYPELGTAARNQFYVLTFEIDRISQFGFVGRGQAWDWATSRGWVAASRGSGLPAQFGFGHREDPTPFAVRIATALDGRNLVRWDEAVRMIPTLAFVLPKDLEALNLELEKHHNRRVLFDDESCPVQIGVVVK